MQEVFEKIKEFICGEIDNPSPYMVHRAQCEILHFVENLEEEYNNGWIPVSSENLPRENEDVLMVIEYADGEVIILEQTFYKCLLDTPGLMVKYWQPDPKLPKEYQPKGD